MKSMIAKLGLAAVVLSIPLRADVFSAEQDVRELEEGDRPTILGRVNVETGERQFYDASQAVEQFGKEEFKRLTSLDPEDPERKAFEKVANGLIVQEENRIDHKVREDLEADDESTSDFFGYGYGWGFYPIVFVTYYYYVPPVIFVWGGWGNTYYV